MRLREAIAAAAVRLTAGSDTPRLDAELLMAHALGIERETMLLSDQSQPEPVGFAALVLRREAGEPIAYITGRRAFWSIELEVAPGVLIPRPDSETLVEAAIEHFAGSEPRRILDLGTGSGALLLAALAQWPQASGLGIDRSDTAVAIARGNARALGLDARARFEPGDWAAGFSQSFDLILCNPPYIEEQADLPRDVAEWEPREALFAGPDGLAAYRELAPQIARLLLPEGVACVEIGSTQQDTAGSLFAAQGLSVGCRQDLGGRPRCLVVKRPKSIDPV
jgi:release factor glutamine methyltransferase